MGVDPNGEFLDTIWDVISLGMSVAEVVANPTDPWAWASLAGDIFDVVVPGVSGVGEAVSAVGKSGKFADRAIDTYRNLKKINKGTNLEIHHIVEKRFAGILGVKRGSMPSIALTKSEHAMFTKMWRDKLPYGNSYTKNEIFNAAVEIYDGEPNLLNAAFYAFRMER